MVLLRYVSDAAASGTRFAEALAEVDLASLFAGARETVESYRPLLFVA